MQADVTGTLRCSRVAYVALSLLLTHGFAGHAARAEDPPQVQQARDAFSLGSSLAKQEQWVDALAAFERSASLRAHPITTYNLAFCEHALGHLTRARRLFRRALDGVDGSRGDMPDDLRALAEARLASIEPRLAHAVVTATSTDIALSVDGRPIDVDVVNVGVTQNGGAPPRPTAVAGILAFGPPQRIPSASFDLTLDPGPHSFVVVGSNGQTKTFTKTLPGGEISTLELVDPTPIPSTTNALPSASASATEPPPAPRADSSVKPSNTAGAAPRPAASSKTLGVVLVGVGAAGLVVGSIAGAIALERRSTLDNVCGASRKNCPESASGTIDSLKSTALVSTVGFVVGASALAAGAYFVLKPAPSSSTSSSTTTVGVTLAPSSVSIVGQF